MKACDCNAKNLEMLAALFATDAHHLYSFNSLGCVLGIDEEEARALVRAGVIRGENDRVPAAELLRFIIERGEAWFMARLRGQIAALREVTEAQVPNDETRQAA